MTDTKLRALADAVLTEADGDASDWFDEGVLDDFLIVQETKACGPFIAAVSPTQVVRLLDRIAALRDVVHFYKDGDRSAAGLALAADTAMMEKP